MDSTWYTPWVTTLEHDGTTYYIVGTAHVSQRSVEEVEQAIKEIEPDVVCVELDKGRYDALTKDSAFRDLDVFKVVREGKTLYLLAHLALASYQKRIGATLGVKPGAELLAAVDAAKQHGIPYELIDRDIQITLKRTWKNIGLWRRFTLLASLVAGGGTTSSAARSTGVPICARIPGTCAAPTTATTVFLPAPASTILLIR